jgi:hypothetical protein
VDVQVIARGALELITDQHAGLLMRRLENAEGLRKAAGDDRVPGSGEYLMRRIT